MNQRGMFIFIFIVIIFIVVTFTVTSSKKINALTQVDVLTKNSIFDIIYNIDNILISSISSDGEKYLSDENKLDTTLTYIINNMDEYKNYIIPCEYNGEEIRCFGKIKKDKFTEILLNIFDEIDCDISQYKYYNDGYIDLYFEPCDYFMCDKKNIISASLRGSSYNITVKYTRYLNDMENKLYVKYELNNSLKIQNVTILSSIIK